MSRPDDDLRYLVTTARVARLATVTAHGRPHVVPICFELDGDILYSAVDRKPKRSRRLKRLDNVRANPRVEVLVDHYDDNWTKLWWVRLQGSARILEPGAEQQRALALLAAKYRQYGTEPPPGPVLAIDLDGWRGWHA